MISKNFMLNIDTSVIKRQVEAYGKFETAHRNVAYLRRIEVSTSREFTQLKAKIAEMRNWIKSMYNE
jgi:hypothetical protein